MIINKYPISREFLIFVLDEAGIIWDEDEAGIISVYKKGYEQKIRPLMLHG